MVFCYQNCSDLLYEKIVLVIEKNVWNSRLKAKNLQNFWDPRKIYLNSESPEQFLKQNAFLTCFWSFIRSNTLEQFTQTVKVQNIFLKKNYFLTCSWIFLRSNTLSRRLRIQGEKNNWDSKTYRKSLKIWYTICMCRNRKSNEGYLKGLGDLWT